MIFEAAPFRQWRPGDGVLHLFLDSLDEARLKIEHVAEVLGEGFEGADFSRLKLRLTCRSADRHDGLEEALRQSFGDEQFGVMELAPLSRKAVEDLGADRGLDPKATSAALIEAGLQPMAMAPETLGFLLDILEDTGKFPERREELYEQGLSLLVAEPDQDRRRDPQQRQSRLSPGRRLAVASRIAGTLVLSGRTSVRQGPGNSSGDQTTLASLSGGEETDGSLAVGRTFSVDEDAVEDALGTGLFTAHEAGGMAFVQATYAEFLCARWLASGALSKAQLEATLYTEVTERARIVPQLHEVASWLARLSPKFCQELLERDPQVLLRADPTGLSDEECARLVDALIAGVRSLEIRRWDRVTQGNYAALKHSNLAEQLRAVIHGSIEESYVRVVACEVAGACKVGELSTELTDLALDASVAIEVRDAAVSALGEMKNGTELPRLMPLALDAQEEDADDEVKGHALSALWPDHLSAEQLFGALSKPKRSNFYGAYRSFLWGRLTEDLAPEDLDVALAWAAKLSPEAVPIDTLQDVKQRIIVKAWSELKEREKLIEPLVGAIVPTLRAGGDLLSNEVRNSHPEVLGDTETRRALLEKVIPRIDEDEIRVYALTAGRPSMLRPEDGDWLVRRLEVALGSDQERLLAELTRGLLMFGHADDEAVYRGRERSELLREMTSSYFDPVVLSSDEAKTARKHYARQKRWEREEAEEESKLDIRGGVDEQLERAEKGELSGFWIATRWLEIDPRRQQYEFTVSDPRRLSGWRLIDPGLQDKYRKLARRYLEEGDPEGEQWFDRNSIYWPAWAGYRCLRMAQETEGSALEELGVGIWKRWAPIVVGWAVDSSTEGESGFHDWAMRELGLKAPKEATYWLLRRLDRELRRDRHPPILWRFEHIWNPELEAGILERAKRPYRDPEHRVALLRLLIEHGCTAALDHARRLLAPSALGNERRRQLALGVAALLYREQPDGAWATTRGLLEADEEFGRELVIALSGRESGVPPKMSSKDTAELYLWILERYPPEEDPDIDGAHSVSPREQIGEWRNRILGILAERGTADAVASLVWLQRKRPELLYLRRVIWTAKEAIERSEWEPPRPEYIVRLSADHRHLFLRSARDLRRAALDSLERAQNVLQGNDGQAVFLWSANDLEPQPERKVSLWIANHFRADLGNEGLFVGRELEVRPNPEGHPGRAVDIQLQARPDSDQGESQVLTVGIEVKCCWHSDLDTAMRDQLHSLYLDADNDQGIYVVAHFDSPDWTEGSATKQRACRRRGLAESRDFFAHQAEEISAQGLSEVSSYVLDCHVQT